MPDRIEASFSACLERSRGGFVSLDLRRAALTSAHNSWRLRESGAVYVTPWRIAEHRKTFLGGAERRRCSRLGRMARKPFVPRNPPRSLVRSGERDPFFSGDMAFVGGVRADLIVSP